MRNLAMLASFLLGVVLLLLVMSFVESDDQPTVESAVSTASFQTSGVVPDLNQNDSGDPIDSGELKADQH